MLSHVRRNWPYLPRLGDRQVLGRPVLLILADQRLPVLVQDLILHLRESAADPLVHVHVLLDLVPLLFRVRPALPRLLRVLSAHILLLVFLGYDVLDVDDLIVEQVGSRVLDSGVEFGLEYRVLGAHRPPLAICTPAPSCSLLILHRKLGRCILAIGWPRQRSLRRCLLNRHKLIALPVRGAIGRRVDIRLATTWILRMPTRLLLLINIVCKRLRFLAHISVRFLKLLEDWALFEVLGVQRLVRWDADAHLLVDQRPLVRLHAQVVLLKVLLLAAEIVVCDRCQ